MTEATQPAGADSLKHDPRNKANSRLQPGLEGVRSKKRRELFSSTTLSHASCSRSTRCGRNRGKIETILVVGRLHGGFRAALARRKDTLRGIGASIRPLMNNGVPISKGDTGGGVMIAGREIDEVGVSWACRRRDGQRTIINGIGVFIHGHPGVRRTRTGQGRHFTIGPPSRLIRIITTTRQPPALHRGPDRWYSIAAGIMAIPACTHR